uniref:Uncharacterized protein n=2 Tax=Picea TaxID=3328 RepID=A0A101M580_PICGL|nr:hypothetical protein ABT39_MTgene1054 [Picea glauca]QHR90024.1 hypothetical protein Q903MT_gene4047 [Picea sitchensis]
MLLSHVCPYSKCKISLKYVYLFLIHSLFPSPHKIQNIEISFSLLGEGSPLFRLVGILPSY